MLLQELQLKVGDSLNIQNFSKTLTEFGFVRMPEVTQKGEFAIKGEIIDAFPFDYEKPVRIQLNFDKVEKIAFLNESLLTEENVKSIIISSVAYLSEEEIVQIEKAARKYVKNAPELVKETIENDIEELKNQAILVLIFIPSFFKTGGIFPTGRFLILFRTGL